MMTTSARTAVLQPSRSLVVRPTPRHCRIVASTLWSLSPDPKWCKKNEKACKILSNIDLTGPIGTKRLCSVSSADYDSEEPQDMRILQHGAIHLVFEAEGSSNPLDSPSRLFVTDVDSKCDVRVDGQPLQKGERALVKPGSVIAMGQEAQYEVQRNVFAHA